MTSPEQLDDDVIMVLGAGDVERGFAITVQHVQLSPRTAQQAHYLRMTLGKL